MGGATQRSASGGYESQTYASISIPAQRRCGTMADRTYIHHLSQQISNMSALIGPEWIKAHSRTACSYCVIFVFALQLVLTDRCDATCALRGLLHVSVPSTPRIMHDVRHDKPPRGLMKLTKMVKSRFFLATATVWKVSCSCTYLLAILVPYSGHPRAVHSLVLAGTRDPRHLDKAAEPRL